jgi:Type I restriction enzyme R protein N terminus (HSDR_N)
MSEEYVRQNIEKALVRQYKYEAGDCEPEFRIKTGSSRKRVDVVVFATGQDHKQENAYLLVETKKPGTNPAGKVDGIDQLKSYMASCLNAQYGLWCFTAWGGHSGRRRSAVLDARYAVPGLRQLDLSRPEGRAPGGSPSPPDDQLHPVWNGAVPS